MRMKNQELWDQLRTAYRPQTPDLDTAAIMAAVRRDAAAHPLRPAQPGLAGGIPVWVCAAAASLALLAAAGAVARSLTEADQNISEAWMQSVQPDEFARNFIPFADDSSL